MYGEATDEALPAMDDINIEIGRLFDSWVCQIRRDWQQEAGDGTLEATNNECLDRYIDDGCPADVQSLDKFAADEQEDFERHGWDLSIFNESYILLREAVAEKTAAVDALFHEITLV